MNPNRQILIKTTAFVLMTAGVLSFFLERTRGRNTDSVLMPDCGGKIERIVCNVNSARRAVLRNYQLIDNIVNGFAPQAEVIIATNDRSAFQVLSNPWPQAVRFFELSKDIPITIWPQDPFVVMQKENGENFLLLSAEFERAKDKQMAASLAEFLNLTCEESGLSFEGGNIVSDRRYVFIGANTIIQNAVTLKKPQNKIVRSFQKQFGRPVAVIGPVPQPIAHIDMMLAPIDDNRIMLADTKWGADIAQQELENNPAGVHEFEDFCRLTFFAHPDIKELYDVNGNPILPPDLTDMTKQAVKTSRKIAPKLDGVAQGLKQLGYEVIRIPFLTDNDDSQEPNATEKDSDKKNKCDKISYPNLTYTNVLIENSNGEKIVYLPQYGWNAFDSQAVKCWRNAGFRVKVINGFTTSSMYGGSLRCCVKVLKRQKGLNY